MQSARLPENEEARIATLRGLNVLDTPRDDRFDRYTRLAAQVFDVPIALISLVDEARQWFKSVEGFEGSETAREISFCAHAILKDDIFEVRNTRQDPLFHDNPLVIEEPRIRYYAGAPLQVPGGYKLGTLCVIDRVPRQLTDADKTVLKSLAEMVVGEMISDVDTETNPANRQALSSTGAGLFDDAPDVRGLSLVLFDIAAAFSAQTDIAERSWPADIFVNLLHKYFPNAKSIADMGDHRYGVLLEDDKTFDEVKATSRMRAEAKRIFRSLGHSDAPPVFVGRILLDSLVHGSFEQVLDDADGMFFNAAKNVSTENEDHDSFLTKLVSWRKTIF